MNDTTGQRIAQRRKMLGLSQEALGQQLGVSRQAISKWESDAATPEIGKLIALSHLFSVSVGWLLCEESDPAPERTEAFTENQLRLLEKVMGQKPPVPRWQKIAVAAVLTVTMLCGVASLVLSLRALDRAENANDTYRDQIDWLFENYGSAQGQLDGISAQLRDLQEQDDIFADYEFSAVAWPQWQGADVTLRGTPQIWNDSDRGVLLVLKEGQEISRVEADWDGFRLTATAGIGKQDDLEYRFLRIGADGSQIQQELHAPGYAHLNSVLSFSTDGRAESWELKDGVLRITDYTFTLSYPQIPPSSDTAQWDSMELVFLQNGREVWRKDVAELLKQHNRNLTEAVSTADPDYWIKLGSLLHIRQGELVIELPELADGDKLSLRVEAAFRAGEQVTALSEELQSWYYDRVRGLE